MAPIGAAASLIGGSTYHSMLGINQYSDDYKNLKSWADTKTMLKNVDYVFIDKISMIDC